MPNHSTKKTTFSGTRLQVDSKLSYDEVLKNLHNLISKTTVLNITKLGTEPGTQEEFEKKVKENLGQSGFTLFVEIDHGQWLKKFGIKRQVTRLIFGNPLIAITMLRHDITAGLFVPVELLLVENEDHGGASITYILPSSLMSTEGNLELLKAAEVLDRKFENLVAKATGIA